MTKFSRKNYLLIKEIARIKYFGHNFTFFNQINVFTIFIYSFFTLFIYKQVYQYPVTIFHYFPDVVNHIDNVIRST